MTDKKAILVIGAGDATGGAIARRFAREGYIDRKSTRLNSSHGYISYAVFCLKKKKAPRRPPHRPHRSALVNHHVAAARRRLGPQQPQRRPASVLHCPVRATVLRPLRARTDHH